MSVDLKSRSEFPRATMASLLLAVFTVSVGLGCASASAVVIRKNWNQTQRRGHAVANVYS